MLAVVEPWFKSLETGRRMSALAEDLGIEHVALVANKVRDERELAAVREFAARHELEIAAVIPFDERLPEAERERAAPLDHAPDAPAIAAIGALAEQLATANGRTRDAAH